MMKKALTLAVALLPSLAWGQGAILQNGAVSVGDLGMFIQDHTLESAAKYRNDTGKGVNPFSVLGEVCSDSNIRTGQYNALCLTHDASGNGLITLDSVNGLPAKTLYLRYNGINYQFPFSTTGVIGPASTAVGNAATWNNTGGTLLGDAGAPPAVSVPTKAALAALPGTAGGGRVRRDGFNTAGDSPSLTYNVQGGTCPLGGGAGDGGSQVPTSDGRCWIAALPTNNWQASWWGIAVPVAYVRNTGNDRGGANTCLFVADPCGTINQGVVQIQKFPWYGLGQKVDIGAGTWNEGVTASQVIQPAIGYSTTVIPQLLLSGAGSASTILNGDGAQCGTIISNTGAILAVEKMTLNATRLSCQSALYANLGGIINVWTDIKFGPANSNHMIVEEVNSFIGIWADYHISGGAVHHMGVTSGGQIFMYPANIIDGNGVTVFFDGTPAFTNQTLLAQHGGQILFANDTTFNGTATSVGGTYFAESGGNIITNNSGITLVPGTGRGSVKTGGFAYPEFKLTVQNTVVPVSGLGSTGTAIISTDGSDSFFITLTPGGTGISAAGSVTATLGSTRQTATGNSVACVATPNGGSGGWDSGATVNVVPNLAAATPTLSVVYKNAAVVPTAGQTYLIGVNCR